MKPIRIFTHAVCEPPGYIGEILDNLDIPYEQVCLFDNEPVAMQLDDVSALIFMGGPGNVNEPTSWMEQEFELIRNADLSDVPMLGICLGAQLMSKALGGKVWQAEQVEVGWHDVKLLESSANYPFFVDMPEQFEVFQWHAHICSPPPTATSVATSICTPCQAWVSRNQLALQFHLEMNARVISGLTEKYAEDLVGDSECVQNRDQIIENIDTRCEAVFKLADRLLIPWFKTVTRSGQSK